MAFCDLLAARCDGAFNCAEGDSEEGKRDWGPLRRLHMARRAERALLSYERTGWLENEPTRVTAHNEVRPSSEMGPIICCLDTSGSMHGARETVAKASHPLPASAHLR